MTDMSNEEISKIIADMTTGGMMVLEVMRPILDMLDGYRQECLRHGFTEEQATQMAVDLHYQLTHTFGNMTK